MKLLEISFSDPLKSTVYGERFLNDTKGRFEEYSAVDPRYDPQGSISSIDLPYTLLSPERCVVLQSNPSAELIDWIRTGDRYRFLWHPDVERRGLDIMGTVPVQPTSSTRTLLAEQHPRVYIKTDLDKKHFRFIRRIQRSSVEHSIAINNDLRDLCLKLPDSSRYAFLPETLGLVVRNGEHEGSGVIFREAKPYPHVTDRRVMMPYHSLYASDPYTPEDKPLLVQLVELHAGRDGLGYFVSEVIGPVIEAWSFLVSARGLLPELHGQNALAEIDEKFNIRRVVHRDFQGTYSDNRIRTNLGLPLFTKHVAGNEAGTTVQSQYSHVFDGMIGRYLLSRLSNTFCSHFDISYERVTAAIRDYCGGIAGWKEADFPETTFRFATSASEQIDNEVQLRDTGKKPDFR